MVSRTSPYHQDGQLICPVIVFGAFFGIMLAVIWFGFARKRYHGPHVSLSPLVMGLC
jgi:hypothetical protein